MNKYAAFLILLSIQGSAFSIEPGLSPFRPASPALPAPASMPALEASAFSAIDPELATAIAMSLIPRPVLALAPAVSAGAGPTSSSSSSSPAPSATPVGDFEEFIISDGNLFIHEPGPRGTPPVFAPMPSPPAQTAPLHLPSPSFSSASSTPPTSEEEPEIEPAVDAAAAAVAPSLFVLAEVNHGLAELPVEGGIFQLEENHAGYTEARRGSGPRGAIAREIRLVFIAGANRTIAGYIRYIISRPGAHSSNVHIGSMEVGKKFRKTGLGTLLGLAALHDARKVSPNCEHAFADTTVRETMTPGGEPVAFYLLTSKFFFSYYVGNRNYTFTDTLSWILKSLTKRTLDGVFAKLKPTPPA